MRPHPPCPPPPPPKPPHGDKPHAGIAGVTLHETHPISILEDTTASCCKGSGGAENRGEGGVRLRLVLLLLRGLLDVQICRLSARQQQVTSPWTTGYEPWITGYKLLDNRSEAPKQQVTSPWTACAPCPPLECPTSVHRPHGDTAGYADFVPPAIGGLRDQSQHSTLYTAPPSNHFSLPCRCGRCAGGQIGSASTHQCTDHTVGCAGFVPPKIGGSRDQICTT